MSVFGNQINLYREKRHLTFEQLAQDISKGQERDYTKSFVQHVTNGTKTNISLSDILLFSNALQVPPVLLLIDTMQPLHACHLPTFNGMLNYRAFRRLEEIFGRPSVYCDEYDDAELTVKTVERLKAFTTNSNTNTPPRTSSTKRPYASSSRARLTARERSSWEKGETNCSSNAWTPSPR